MNSTINLNAVLVAATLGIMLSAIMLGVVGFPRKAYLKKDNFERWILVVALIINIANPIVFLSGGRSTLICKIAIRVCTVIVFMSNAVLGLLWWNLVALHLQREITSFRKVSIWIIAGILTALLILNFFVPIVYSIDENNVYHREVLSQLYTFAEIGFSVDSIVIYMIAKKEGGVLKFFPIWQFVLPVIIGAIIQQMYYGISMVVPCFAISAMGMVLGLQNNNLYADRLTGAYNRFYLNHLKEKVNNRKDATFTVMMLDINDFKYINDNFGHAEGDAALIKATEIFTNEVGTLGNIIRYAGDEFIVILNTEDPDAGMNYSRKIKKSLEEYNESSQKGYKLSVAVGSAVVNLSKTDVDSILNVIDAKMYEDKKLFYTQRDRRNH